MLPAALLLAAFARGAAAAPKPIALSPRSPPSPFSLALGVDRGPGCAGAASIGAQLRGAGTALIRTHDAGVLDWCVLFPDPAADPADPASYRWAAGDAYFKSILDAGFAPYLRLGASWSAPSPACTAPDAATFAAVAVKTLAHYNDGLWGGFSGRRVAAVEIFNEPDEPRFWNRSADAFHELFDATARALKAYDAALVVGGPGVAQPLANASYPYSFGLLDFAAARGTPMDFFSWHSYGAIAAPPAAWGHSPEQIYGRTIGAVEAALAARGLGRLKQHVTEWQPAILGNASVTGSAEAASFTAAALSLMAAAPSVAVSVFYPGCEGTGPDGSWGMFLDYGNGTTAYRREGRAWAAVGATLRDAPLALRADFAPEADFTVLAGANAAGTLASVVVAARASAYDALALAVPLAGAAGGAAARAAVAVLLLDGESAEPPQWANSTAAVEGGSVAVAVPRFAPPAVAWVLVSAL